MSRSKSVPSPPRILGSDISAVNTGAAMENAPPQNPILTKKKGFRFPKMWIYIVNTYMSISENMD